MTFVKIFTLSQPLRKLPLFLRYLGATAIVFLFFGLRSMTEAALGGYPFLMFFPAIIFIALVLDRGTGAFSVLLSATLAWWYRRGGRSRWKASRCCGRWASMS